MKILMMKRFVARTYWTSSAARMQKMRTETKYLSVEPHEHSGRAGDASDSSIVSFPCWQTRKAQSLKNPSVVFPSSSFETCSQAARIYVIKTGHECVGASVICQGCEDCWVRWERQACDHNNHNNLHKHAHNNDNLHYNNCDNDSNNHNDQSLRRRELFRSALSVCSIGPTRQRGKCWHRFLVKLLKEGLLEWDRIFFLLRTLSEMNRFDDLIVLFQNDDVKCWRVAVARWTVFWILALWVETLKLDLDI